MLKTNLQQLSKQWEAKSLLINIANQLDAGVADSGGFTPFFKKYNTVGADCSGWNSALNDDPATSYEPEKMFFLGSNVIARKKNDFLLVRIAPMASTLSGVDLDGARRKSQIRQLELTAKVGDGDHQAAFLVWFSIISIPSENVTP